MDSQFFLKNLWKWKCGLPEEAGPKKLNIYELMKTQWDGAFEKLMRNRMVLGTFRYGDFRDVGQKKYDRIGSAINRLQKYVETGNKEHLVDVSNLCMIEFSNPNHKNAHFEPIDDGEHVKIIN